VDCIPPPPIYPEPNVEPSADAEKNTGAEEDPSTSSEQTASLSPRRLRLDPTHVAYARTARQALLESFGPDSSAPERLLLDLAAAELPIHCSLVEAEAQLAARLESMLLRDDVKSVATLARALRHVSLVTHAVSSRVQNVLATAVALKAQRRLVELHRPGAAK